MSDGSVVDEVSVVTYFDVLSAGRCVAVLASSDQGDAT